VEKSRDRVIQRASDYPRESADFLPGENKGTGYRELSDAGSSRTRNARVRLLKYRVYIVFTAGERRKLRLQGCRAARGRTIVTAHGIVTATNFPKWFPPSRQRAQRGEEGSGSGSGSGGAPRGAAESWRLSRSTRVRVARCRAVAGSAVRTISVQVASKFDCVCGGSRDIRHIRRQPCAFLPTTV